MFFNDMGLEISIRKYLVVEVQTKTYHDSPAIGAFEVEELSRKEYGPYFFKIRARRKITALKKDKLKNPLWQQDPNVKYHLHSDITEDIHYGIQKI